MPKVRCPHCGKETVYARENRYRPFCSERCQVIDLGNWADGRYTIPIDPDDVSPTQVDDRDGDDGDQSADGRVLH